MQRNCLLKATHAQEVLFIYSFIYWAKEAGGRSCVIIKACVNDPALSAALKGQEEVQPAQGRPVTWDVTLRRARPPDVGEQVVDVREGLRLDGALLPRHGLKEVGENQIRFKIVTRAFRTSLGFTKNDLWTAPESFSWCFCWWSCVLKHLASIRK